MPSQIKLLLVHYSIIVSTIIGFLLSSCNAPIVSPLNVYEKATAKENLEKEYALKKRQDPANHVNHFIYSYILYRNKKYDRALSEIKELVVKNPFNAEYHVLEGQIQFELENYTSAIQSFSLATEYNKNLLNAHYGLALSYYQISDLENARHVNDVALLIEPKNFAARLLKVKIDTRNNPTTAEHLELLRELELLQKEKPKATAVIELSTELYLNQGQVKNADTALSNFIKLNGTSDELNKLLCQVKLTAGKIEQARKIANTMKQGSLIRWDCEINILLAEEDYQAAYNLFLEGKPKFYISLEHSILEAKLLTLIGQAGKAVENLEIIYFNNQQNNPTLNYQLAATYFETKEYEKSYRYIGKTLQITPNNLDAKILSIRILLKLGHITEAEKIFYSEIFAPFNASIVELQGDIALTQKNYAQAERFYNVAQLLKFQISTALKLAELAFTNQQYDQAINRLNRLLIIKPADISVLIALAKFHYFLRQYSEAIPLLSKIPDPDNNIGAGMFLGLSYIESGQIEKGLELLLVTANNFNQDVALIDALTYQLARQKRYQEAIPYLESLIALNPEKANYLNQRLADLYRLTKNSTKETESRWRYFFH